MSTAVYGDVILRGHCAVQWQDEVLPPRRSYFIEDRHCRECLTELLRRLDGAVMLWFRRDVTGGEEDTTHRVKGTRRIGKHCAFRWERCDDLTVKGRPLRLYWIERHHCGECIAILRAVCKTEADAEFFDLAERGLNRPPSRPELPQPNLPPGAALPDPAPRGDGAASAAPPSARRGSGAPR